MNTRRAMPSKAPMPKKTRFFQTFVLALATLATSSSASAEPPKSADRAALGSFSEDEQRLLRPFLQHGPVALIEFNGDAELPAVIFATRVNAPAKRVAKTITGLHKYPKFMPAITEIDVNERVGSMTAYDWKWQTSVFTLAGSSLMTEYPAHPEKGHRITVKNTGGDLGVGRLKWSVVPTGSGTSLLTLSSRMDLRDANWVTRQIQRGERSVNRTANIALSFAMMRGVVRRSQGNAPTTDPVHDKTARGLPAGLRRPEVNVQKLKRLLGRGDLLLMEMSGETLHQVASVGRMFQRYDKVRKVVADPKSFATALVPGSYVKVKKTTGKNVDFEWGVDMPLVGTSGQMRLTDGGSLISLDAVGGAIRGGQWRLEPVRLRREGAILSWGKFDPKKISWLTKMIAEGNRDFGHGIVIGSQLMVTRAIRTRSRI